MIMVLVSEGSKKERKKKWKKIYQFQKFLMTLT